MNKAYVLTGIVLLSMFGCGTQKQDNTYFDINNNYHKTTLTNKANQDFVVTNPGVYEKTFEFSENEDSVTLTFSWDDQSENTPSSGSKEYVYTNEKLKEWFGE